MRKIISYIIILVGVLTQLAASDLTSYELHSFGEGGQNKMMYDRRQRPGAVYLDGGIDSAATVVEQLLREEWQSIDPALLVKDPKPELQELLQKFGRPLPRYLVKETRGVPHERVFIVECVLDEPPDSFLGKGGSHQKAEQNAAELALHSLKA